MNAEDRRREIISFLMLRHHSTAAELAREFGGCMLETMLKIYGAAEEEDKRILSQVIGKYGPDKLKI